MPSNTRLISSIASAVGLACAAQLALAQGSPVPAEQRYPVTPAQRATASQVAQAGVPLSELAPNAPDSAPTTKPVRRPHRCMIADNGCAQSIDPITAAEIGSVAQQAFGARLCPARPAMVKIIGSCAPKIACEATRTSTLRRARRSWAKSVMGEWVGLWFRGGKMDSSLAFGIVAL